MKTCPECLGTGKWNIDRRHKCPVCGGVGKYDPKEKREGFI